MVQDQTQIDVLTGLSGRRAFDSSLQTAITLAETGNNPLSLAFIDVDRFEELNREFGHKGGDRVLKSLADALSSLGANARPIRYGGDEFAVIFENCEREQAFLRLEAVRATVEKLSIQFDGGDISPGMITISGGVAAYPIDGSSLNELFRKADGALYRAKSTGRNKIALAYEERMSPKTSHYTLTQLERLGELAKEQGVGEAVLLREALDDLLSKYKHSFQILDRH